MSNIADSSFAQEFQQLEQYLTTEALSLHDKSALNDLSKVKGAIADIQKQLSPIVTDLKNAQASYSEGDTTSAQKSLDSALSGLSTLSQSGRIKSDLSDIVTDLSEAIFSLLSQAPASPSSESAYQTLLSMEKVFNDALAELNNEQQASQAGMQNFISAATSVVSAFKDTI